MPRLVEVGATPQVCVYVQVLRVRFFTLCVNHKCVNQSVRCGKQRTAFSYTSRYCTVLVESRGTVCRSMSRPSRAIRRAARAARTPSSSSLEEIDAAIDEDLVAELQSVYIDLPNNERSGYRTTLRGRISARRKQGCATLFVDLLMHGHKVSSSSFINRLIISDS